MARHVQLGDVRTWYDEQGTGDALVLLHGGLLDSRFFAPNLAPLVRRFHVYTPDRRGHGHTPDVDGPISYQLMTDDTIAFLDQVVARPADLVGHSDGAVIALMVAMQRPDLVHRLVMISGGYSTSGYAVAELEQDSDRVIQLLGPAYGEVSPDGEEHFPVVARKINDMNKTEPDLDAAQLTAVRQRCLLVFADDDLFTLDHAVDMYDALPNAELAVVPGTSHFLTREKPDLVNTILLQFLLEEPVPTAVPIRRAGPRA